MSWFFYNKEGKLLYDVVAGSVGDADTLDGIDSTGFVRLGAPGLNVGNVDIDGSVTLPVVTTAVNLPLNDTHRTVLVNSSGGPVTVTLPASPLAGQVYEIRDVGSTGAGAAATNNITINRNGNTIDGVGSNLVLSQNGTGVILVWDGSRWITLANRSFLPTSINADTLDSLDSTQFLRSDVDDTALGNITFSKSVYNPVSSLTDATNPNLLNDTYRTVRVNTVSSAGNITVTLPASPVAGQWYEVLDAQGGASTNNIVINPNGNSINGSGSNITLNTNYDAIVLVCIDPTNWSIVSWRFAPSGPVAIPLGGLSDVTITGPAEGELLRYDTPANQWVNVPTATVDDGGSLHLRSAGSGIILGENAGPGLEASIINILDNTVSVSDRLSVSGTMNNKIDAVENGVNTVGDVFTPTFPSANTLLCRTSAGDIFVRLSSLLSTSGQPIDGDTLTVKDSQGDAGTNVLALVAEGVRRRNVPLLQVTSTTGTISDASTTTTPGGVGVDEVQDFKVTGSGTFKVTFDGVEAAAVLTETSNAAAVKAAIESLSPHANYGNFTVSTSGTSVLSGISVTFNGGTLIDGEAEYTLGVPWSSAKVVFSQDPSGVGSWYVV